MAKTKTQPVLMNGYNEFHGPIKFMNGSNEFHGPKNIMVRHQDHNPGLSTMAAMANTLNWWPP